MWHVIIFSLFIKNGFNFDSVFKSFNFILYNTSLSLGLKTNNAQWLMYFSNSQTVRNWHGSWTSDRLFPCHCGIKYLMRPFSVPALIVREVRLSRHQPHYRARGRSVLSGWCLAGIWKSLYCWPRSEVLKAFCWWWFCSSPLLLSQKGPACKWGDGKAVGCQHTGICAFSLWLVNSVA